MNLDHGDTRVIIEEGKKEGLLRNQLAYVLATAYWETGKTMKPVKEAYWLSEDWRKANLKRYYPYYGRGYVQLTWKDNYKDYGIADNPDKALEPAFAAYVLIDGMVKGRFTGKKLSDYITLQASNFTGARRIVNGTDKAAEIAKLAKEYDSLLLKEGYGVDIDPVDDDEPVTTVPELPSDLSNKATGELLLEIAKLLFEVAMRLMGKK